MRATEPTQLGEFTILEKIGQGAMGAVYKARQGSLGRIVALKILPAHYAGDAEFVARFRHEASAAASLNHPNIVQIYAAGEEEGAHYFAMEYVEGESLGDRLDRKGRVEAQEAIAVAHYVALALDYAWKKAGVIHRDIKPDNIFLSREGTVKVGDLGLAKVLGGDGAGLTQTGMTLGTPYYVSPEQAIGTKEIDFRADMYSIGCTIFHALCGQPPYRGDSAMSVMLQHISQPEPKILEAWPECPPAIVGLLNRMLRKKPEERYASYEELMQQMAWVSERLEQPTPVDQAAMSMFVPAPGAKASASASVTVARTGATVARATMTPLPAASRSSGGKWLAAGAVVALLAGGAFFWQPWKKPAPLPPVAAAAVPAPSAATPAPATPVPIPATPAPVARTEPTPLPVAPAASTPTVAMTISTPAPATPPRATPAPPRGPDAAGFTPMLDEGRLGFWQQYGEGGFTMENDMATSWMKPGQPFDGAWFFTREPYQDFTFKTEFRIGIPMGNSGVFVRSALPRKIGQRYVAEGGYQVDVSEDPNPLEMTGAICMNKAPTSVPQKAREWNDLEISVFGQRYLVKVNGVLVNDFIGKNARSGYIGLQNYKVGGVQYRNMRIKELSAADIAAIENPPVVSAEERWKKAIDLLALVDVAADTSGGLFTPTPSGLVTNQNTLCQLELPYRPPAEYDFRLSFTYLDGVGEFAQMMAKANRSFEWMIAANGSLFGFQMISGADVSRNPTKRQFRLDRSRKYTSLVEVREGGLTSYLDGNQIAAWKTNYSDLSPKDHWTLRDGTRLGIGTMRTAAIIHSAEVLEVTGKGTLLRPAKGMTNTSPTVTPNGKNDEQGFVSLFNGRDLTGWEGNMALWSVRDGVITGESPGNGAAPANTCLIWKGGKPADFELRMSFKMVTGNSGVQYRSKVLNAANWKMGGYQFEIDSARQNVNGALYDEAGHRAVLGQNAGSLYLANVGENVRLTASQRSVENKLSDPFAYRPNDWNELVIIARGNHLIHKLNGNTTIELTDEDAANRETSGSIGLQLHAGPAQRYQFKDIRLKEFVAGVAR